jgi:hypothetical protein
MFLMRGIIPVLTGCLSMKNVTRCIALLALILCLVGITAAIPFADECEVYGSLKIDGYPVVTGVELVAVIGADEVARASVTQTGAYSLVIRRYDPQKPDLKGYRTEEDIITVYADGRRAEPSFAATAGRRKIDLTVKTTSEVEQTTWGKIKALFK